MTYNDIVLIITKHAREQMFNRGIDEDQIKQVIKKGAKIRQTEGFKAVHMYVGVSYKLAGKKYLIKTVTIE